jgi:hypothetical protein
VRILVFLRGARTVYLLEKRGHLRQLTTVGPSNELDSVDAVRGTWNPNARSWDWKHVPLRHIAKTSISVVEEARGVLDVGLPLAEVEA